jgi:hypothetical protein
VSSAVLWFGVLVAALMPVIASYLPKPQPDVMLHGQELFVAGEEKLEKQDK